MKRKQIECPNCGNEITAKGIKAEQRCPYCKREYKVILIRNNIWEAVEATNYENI